eukprot:9126971-Prorocentrum_lima.AAC.1
MDTEPSGDLKRSILDMFVDHLRGCGAMKNTLMYFDSVDEGIPVVVTRLTLNRTKMQQHLKQP